MSVSPIEHADKILTENVLADRVTSSLDVVLSKSTAQPQLRRPSTPPCDPSVRDVTLLPTVMDDHKWAQGATLMRKWLNAPEAISPNFGQRDKSTITMDYVLSFPRAKKIYDGIFSQKLYFAVRARKQLIKLLSRMNGGGLKDAAFGYDRPVEELLPGPNQDSYDVAYATVGLSSDIDGLTASLNRFDFKVVLAGLVRTLVKPDPNAGRYRVTINKVGVFVNDRYDFEGFQPLGCWNICTNEVDHLACEGGVQYFNSDFRDYRTRMRRGGDIWVLSDVKSTALDPAVSFLWPE